MLKVITIAVAIAAVSGVAGAQGQAKLRREAKISAAAARAIALAEIPNGKVKSTELEREHGTLIYSIDVSVPGKPGVEEFAISALDGSIVARQHETPQMEKKEAALEAEEKKAKK